MARKRKKNNNEDGSSTREGGVRLSTHPRARRQIAMAKSWAGLVCFIVAVLLCLRTSLPLTDTLLRALVAGIAGYLVVWALALIVWRHIALTQIEDLRLTLIAEMEERALEQESELEHRQAEQIALMEAEAARLRSPEGALEG